MAVMKVADMAPMHRAELDTAAALVVAEEQLTREKRQRLRMAQERDVAHKELRHARSIGMGPRAVALQFNDF